MNTPRSLYHVLFCADPSGADWQALTEAPGTERSLYAWAPAGAKGAEPPDPVRGALWAGLTAVGDRLGFMAERKHLTAGSVYRPTAQGWLARTLRPLPGTMWTGDAETFDLAFGEDWSRGGQVLWALPPEARIPEIGEDLLIPWVRTVALDMPPMPPGVPLAVRAGTGGGLFAVFATSARLLETFTDAFRAGLDWRHTTFQRVRERDLAPALVRLRAKHTPPETAPPQRWFRMAAQQRTGR